MTECECELAGYCARHKVKKPANWHSLCKTNERYFRAWEAGSGPGQNTIPENHRPKPAYNHWEPLHKYAVEHADDWSEAKAKKFYRKWERKIPNSSTCKCKENWKKLGMVPDYSSPKAFFEWSWKAHNTVNAKLEKPIVSLCDCYEIWWPERKTNRNGVLTNNEGEHATNLPNCSDRAADPLFERDSTDDNAG